MSQWGPGNCLQPQDWEVEMNLFSRVHNWELSLWPLWSQKHPSDWPEKIKIINFYSVKKEGLLMCMVITFIVKFSLDSQSLHVEPPFPTEHFWTAARLRIFWSTPNAKATTRCTTTSSYISWQPWTIGKFYSPKTSDLNFCMGKHKKCTTIFLRLLNLAKRRKLTKCLGSFQVMTWYLKFV